MEEPLKIWQSNDDFRKFQIVKVDCLDLVFVSSIPLSHSFDVDPVSLLLKTGLPSKSNLSALILSQRATFTRDYNISVLNSYFDSFVKRPF